MKLPTFQSSNPFLICFKKITNTLFILFLCGFSLSPLSQADAIKTMDCGYYICMYIDDVGQVWGAGGDNYGVGNLGLGGTQSYPTFAQLSQVLPLAKQVVTAGFRSYVLSVNGELYGAGNGVQGAWGDGTTIDRPLWANLGHNNITLISGNYQALFAIKNDNSLWAAGYYAGFGDPNEQNFTLRDTGLSNVIDVSSIEDNAMALMADGTVWVTGENYNDTLGTGSGLPVNSWTQTSLSNIVAISNGFEHSLALTCDGRVMGAGLTANLGLGGAGSTGGWVDLGLSNVRAIAAGYFYSIVVFDDGSAWGVGKNNLAELGLGHKNPVVTWTDLGLSSVVNVKNGYYAPLIKTVNGTVYSTGEENNDGGMLGLGHQNEVLTWTPIFTETVTECLPGDPGCTLSCSAQEPDENEGKSECGNPGAGNPILISTGNKYQEEVDYLSAEESMPLSIARSYNSVRGSWRFMGQSQLSIAATTVLWTRDDGKGLTFVDVNGVWQDSDRPRLQLVELANTNWKLTDGDLNVYIFDANGVLQSKTDLYGSAHSYTYNPSGELQTITHSAGSSLTFVYDTNGQVDTITTDTNDVYDYAYTGSKLSSVTFPDQATRTYHYEDTSHTQALTGITDENGNRYATWTYDSAGRATSSEHAAIGSGIDKVTLDYTHIGDATDPRVTVTNELGKDTTYRFTSINGANKVTQVAGHASANCAAANQNYTYHSSGLVETQTDWSGNLTRFTYWSDGLEKNRTEAEGTADERVFYTEWDHTNKLKTLERLEGQYEISYQYYPNNRLQSRTVKDLTSFTSPYTTNGRTRTWNYTYTYWNPGTDTQLKSVSVDGPRSVADTILTEYTNQGYLDKVTNALGQVTDVTEYFLDGRIKTVLGLNGVETRYTYKPRGWLATVTVENGSNDAVTTYGYDNVGQITDITLPNGVTLHYDYDGAHRLYQITDGDGNKITYTLDNAGNITKEAVSDSNGVVKRSVDQVFDELSRLRNTIGATDNQEDLQGYDVNNNLTSSQLGGLSGGSAITRLYDALDRIKQINHEDGGVSQYAYDDQGKLTQVTDQNTLVTSYTYDGFGDLIQTASPDTGTTTYQYDEASNRTQRTDARGVVSQYSYDVLNRLTAVTYPANTVENVSYGYDDITNNNVGIGRLTSMTDSSGSTAFKYDNLGNLIEKATTLTNTSYTVQMAYDLSGNLTQLTYPSGRLVHYGRDNLGQINSITTQANSGATLDNVITAVTYQPFGPISSYTYGNGLTHTLSHDADYRITGNQVQGSNTVLDLGYDYDLRSNITDINDWDQPANDQDFQYDPANRLSQAMGEYGQLNYQYDGVGNRTLQTINSGGITTTETYNYSLTSNRLDSVDSDDGTNQTQRSFQYSLNGNVIQDTQADGTVNTLTYNQANRYSELSRNSTIQATYQYNALGQRVVKQLGANTEHYHYDEQGQLLAVSNGSGAVQREYIYLNGMQVAVLADASAANTAPVANAGTDSSANANQTVTLDGSGSADSDGTITSYSWVQTAGPAVSLSNSNQAQASFAAPSLATTTALTFTLTVTDDDGATAVDQVDVTVVGVPNVAPVANAGAGSSANANQAVTLDGSGSTDSDGTITSYSWVQTAGPAVTLSNANQAQASFTAPSLATTTVLTFDLTVTDDDGATAVDQVAVTVVGVPNVAPVSNAGTDSSANANQAVTLDGSGSTDSDGTITSYSWVQAAGPAVTLSNANQAQASFTAPSLATTTVLTFDLTVTDDDGATAVDQVSVTVVGGVTSGSTATLNGVDQIITGSIDTPIPFNGGSNIHRYFVVWKAPAVVQEGIIVGAETANHNDGNGLYIAVRDTGGQFQFTAEAVQEGSGQEGIIATPAAIVPNQEYRLFFMYITDANRMYWRVDTTANSGPSVWSMMGGQVNQIILGGRTVNGVAQDFQAGTYSELAYWEATDDFDYTQRSIILDDGNSPNSSPPGFPTQYWPLNGNYNPVHGTAVLQGPAF